MASPQASNSSQMQMAAHQAMISSHAHEHKQHEGGGNRATHMGLNSSFLTALRDCGVVGSGFVIGNADGVVGWVFENVSGTSVLNWLGNIGEGTAFNIGLPVLLGSFELVWNEAGGGDHGQESPGADEHPHEEHPHEEPPHDQQRMDHSPDHDDEHQRQRQHPEDYQGDNSGGGSNSGGGGHHDDEAQHHGGRDSAYPNAAEEFFRGTSEWGRNEQHPAQFPHYHPPGRDHDQGHGI